MTVLASGPQPAQVLIVGEAPGAEDLRLGQPLAGAGGHELTKMLAEAGIVRTACRITNVTGDRPPLNDIAHFFLTKAAARKAGISELYGRFPTREVSEGLVALREEIEQTRPNVIIALGGAALWALTGREGISNWRSSMLMTQEGPFGVLERPVKVLPTLHLAAVLRQWEQRSVVVHDLRRARLGAASPEPWDEPKRFFHIRPDIVDVRMWLARERGKLTSVDIETINRHIALVALATSTDEALCIPFMTHETRDGNYWSRTEEHEVIALLRDYLENSPIVGQNFLYDTQYLLRHFCIYPRVVDDTSYMQHVCFPGSPKALDYLSSMYCKHHVYWKDELKDYKRLPVDEELFRNYNSKDAVITLEVAQVLKPVLANFKLETPYAFQMSLFKPVLRMMVHGIRVSKEQQDTLAVELLEAAGKHEEVLEHLIGTHVGVGPKAKKWYRSPKQVATLFYTELGCDPVLHRKTKKPTMNAEALDKIGAKNPIFKYLCDLLTTYRSLGTYHSNFATAASDADSRMRCSYNIAGTETFRFTSSENAFGGGLNLQNLPRYDPKENPLLPNIRAIYKPDEGQVLLDWDLSKADLQIVVWEADDTELKQMLRAKVDMHTENAKVIFNTSAVSDKQYYDAKRFVHATNYGSGPRTIAGGLGITLKAAEIAQARWFGAHPKIKEWHKRVLQSVWSTRRIHNAFGYHRIYFGRLDAILPEALAWIPQSTVAIVINKGMKALEVLPWVHVLLQVHDSLLMQIPADRYTPADLKNIERHLLTPIPYADPLTIPVGCKSSPTDWGSLKKVELSD